MRILVFGGRGDLGTALVDRALKRGHEAIGLSRAMADITNRLDVLDVVAQAKPDVIVNCAAFHRVDDAENDLATAMEVNGHGAANVSVAARRAGARLVYISTDYVFAGTKDTPYIETDDPQPLSVYGRSKVAGEFASSAHDDPGWLIVRTAGLFGGWGRNSKGGDFFTRILAKVGAGETLTLVSDIQTSLSYVPDIALKIIELLEGGATGIRHVVNAGEATWFGAARIACDAAELPVEMNLIHRSVWPPGELRPAYSVLGSEYEETRIDTPWERRVRLWARALRGLPLNDYLEPTDAS